MILETVELGQHERRAPVLVESGEQLVDLRPLGDGSRHDVVVDREFRDALAESASPDAASRRVDTRPTRDREQPVAGGSVGPVPVERRNRTTVGLLGQVFCVLAIAQVTAQIEDVTMRREDELLERIAIAALGFEQQAGQPIHREPVCRGNSTTPSVDRHIVEHRETSGSSDRPADPCDGYRMLVSASLDGEASVADELALERHLAGCLGCTEFRDDAAALTRHVRVRASVPDSVFVARVMADVPPSRLGRTGWPRPVLAWCAIVIAFQGFAPLFLGEADGAPAHLARHIGASSLALACGLLYAAWRPARAYGLLPFVGALVATTLAAAVVDTVDGSRSALAEATHAAEIVGLVVLWIVGGSPGWDRFVSWLRPGRSAPGALRSTS